jgi:large subunit ribosomal protein L29
VKTDDLVQLGDDELVQKARETRDELFNVKVKHATGQLENTAKLHLLRRDIARMETLLRTRREAIN